MVQPVGWLVGAVVVSVLGSLFAGGDAAVNAVPEAVVQALGRDPGSPYRRLAEDRHRVFARWFVCRVIAIASSAAMLQRAADDVGVRTLGPVLAMLGALAVYGTLAELFVTLGRQRPEKLGPLALRGLQPLEWAVAPLADPLAWLGRLIAKAVPKPRRDARTTEAEVAWLVAQGERAGALSEQPAQIIRRALAFRERQARGAMVPRAKVSAIEITASLARALEIVELDGHSRYPVYQGTLDQIVGLVYVKDLFRAVRENRINRGRVADIVRSPALFVSETQPLTSILREMQSRRQHLAIVSDEFGGTAGVLTLEDVLEELVGDIRDEYDIEGQFEDLGNGRYMVDGSVSIADLAAHMQHDIARDGGAESLGGLLVNRAGRVPKPGTSITIDGLSFIVREADEKRVVKVEVAPA